MQHNNSAQTALEGLTDWTGISSLVSAFCGGSEAVFAILIICVAIAVVVCFPCYVGYLCYCSRRTTQVQIERIRKHSIYGGRT